MTDTFTNAGDAALIAIINAKQPKGTVWCFVANPTPDMKSFVLGYATLGEAGWTPLFTDHGMQAYLPAVRFDDFALAYDEADRLNALLPYSAAACAAIVADTMHRSRMREEKGAEFTVKLDCHTPLLESERHSVANAIEDLLVDLRGPNGEVFDIEVE